MSDTKMAKTWVRLAAGYSTASESVPNLPAGMYSISAHEGQVYLNPLRDAGDELVVWKDSVSDRVLSSIRHFWTKEDRFRKLGVAWKRGILLWGPPGGGKTSVLRMVANWFVESDGIALMSTDVEFIIAALQMIRRTEPDRPIVVMFEEIDQVGRASQANLASLLDGEFQVDNVVFVATTNYPEKLDPKLTNRPSRFDVIEFVGMPNEEARLAFLEARTSGLREEIPMPTLRKWAKDTKGFSIAHLKEVLLSTYVFEIPYASVLERLKDMMSGKSISKSAKNASYAHQAPYREGAVVTFGEMNEENRIPNGLVPESTD